MDYFRDAGVLPAPDFTLEIEQMFEAGGYYNETRYNDNCPRNCTSRKFCALFDVKILYVVLHCVTIALLQSPTAPSLYLPCYNAVHHYPCIYLVFVPMGLGSRCPSLFPMRSGRGHLGCLRGAEMAATARNPSRWHLVPLWYLGAAMAVLRAARGMYGMRTLQPSRNWPSNT